MTPHMKSTKAARNAISIILGLACLLGSFGGPRKAAADEAKSMFNLWESVGARAAAEALDAMKERDVTPQGDNLIALTNAGYAEINGLPTVACLDGLSRITGVSRGRSTLLEIHSAPDAPLWFAVYDRASGACAYLQVDPSAVVDGVNVNQVPAAKLFQTRAVEVVNADHLYTHAVEFKEKMDSKVFNGNEFRIISIANAVAAGAPAYAARAFEFHDHYCPGVTSGILLVNYLKQHFPLKKGGSYFVHSVQAWCKEDALVVLLNATPGKGGYAVGYATDEDRAGWTDEVKNASTIVYRKDPESGKWDGLVLAFKWVKDACPSSGQPMLDKLCADLWYLRRMHEPAAFVEVVKRFELPQGVKPVDWARPGVDPMEKLGLKRGQ